MKLLAIVSQLLAEVRKKMRNNKGMTLVEVLIGSIVFAIVSMAFTTGLFMVIRLTNAANDRKIMERAAEDIILLGDAWYVENIDDRGYGSTEDLDYVVAIEINSPLSADPISSRIYGKKLTATVEYGYDFHGEDAVLFDFIFEGLKNEAE